MAASNDELRKRYASLSDAELIELHKTSPKTSVNGKANHSQHREPKNQPKLP
jgi:hypothetical protein